MNIQKIPSGTNPNQKKEAIFIMCYSESQIWKDYDGIPEAAKETMVPLVLMMQRWDGKIGFVGGEVDSGEDLTSAAVREFWEEAGFALSEKQVQELMFVCSHESDKLVAHLLALKVSERVLRDILANSHKAQHFITEGTLFTAQMINYSNMSTFSNFMKNNFALTVKEQIKEAINLLGWKEKYNLK